jgi:hypothetical protein
MTIFDPPDVLLHSGDFFVAVATGVMVFDVIRTIPVERDAISRI